MNYTQIAALDLKSFNMKQNHKTIILASLATIFIITSTSVFACASCGCTLSSDWENLNFSGTSGIKLDIRYDYLNQNQLRSGTADGPASADN